MKTRLEISLAWRERAPMPGSQALAVHRGGPSTLLRWLETQLGLQPDRQPRIVRVAAFRSVLHEGRRPSFEESFEIDPWATAAELLDRIDQLRMAGWSGEVIDGAPPLVNDLAPVSSAVSGGEADRLEAVCQALNAGQRLPKHCCELHDDPESWPALWQQILKRLDIERVQSAIPAGPPQTILRDAQDRVLKSGHAAPDESLRWLQASSFSAACEAVADMLLVSRELLAETVICAYEPHILVRLDQALRRRGLAPGGANAPIVAHPVLEVLPLVLKLTWAPPDPAMVMALLTLENGAIPGSISQTLTRALVKNPGVGSRAWERAWKQLPAGSSYAKTLADAIFHKNHEPRGEAASVKVLVKRCQLVGEWARACVAKHRSNTSIDTSNVEAFAAAEAQSFLLADILSTIEGRVSSARLGRLLEMTVESPCLQRRNEAGDGGPVFVNDLADIESGCRRLIWLGLEAKPAPRRLWASDEVAQLSAAKLKIDNGEALTQARLRAQWRGLSQVREAVLAIDIAGSEPGVTHPVWSEIQAGFDLPAERPVVLEKALADGDTDRLAPWAPATQGIKIIEMQTPPTHWELPEGLIHDRSTISASETETRIACPLKWVFNYSAQLNRTSARALPAEHLMQGIFLHQVMEDVFTNRLLPSPNEAAQLAETSFNERIEYDATVLAMPANAMLRAGLLRDVKGAARKLADALARSGYKVVGMEQKPEVGDQLLNRLSMGAIDCLAINESGQELVIDAKHSRSNIYSKKLKNGASIQLATYAAMRHSTTGTWPEVAYLLLKSGALITRKQGVLYGETAIPGKSAESVWHEITAALSVGGRWLNGTEAVPVRPLQDPADRHAGWELAIEDPTGQKTRAETVPCLFCDFRQLCGVGSGS